MIGNKFKNIERDYSTGIARYTHKKSETEKLLQDRDNPKNSKAVLSLMTQLENEVKKQQAQRRAVFRQLGDKKNNPVNTGDALRARNYDARQTTNNIDRLIRQLASFGVKTIKDKAGNVSFKNMNEGGQSDMVYDVARLKQMKLETFQESAAGAITKEATDYLLKYFDVMIEEAKGEDINTLVTDYVAACKDGDDAKKADLKEKITAASNCKKAKEELCALKEKLSDKEKAFVEELDAEICGSKDKESDSESDEPVQESGGGSEAGGRKETQKSVEDMNKSAEDLEKKIQDGAKKAGTDNKEAFDQLLSAASESAITDVGREALLDYMTESVATGDMDADDAILITTLMSM